MLKTILITGGAGFIGSNLALFLKRCHPDVKIVCFDNLIRKGSEINARHLADYDIDVIRGDIRHKDELMSLPKVDVIVECSAEPSILASIENPEYTIQTNLMGSVHCLDLARRDQANMIFLSTSRVYPVDGLNKVAFFDYDDRFDWEPDLEQPGVSYDGVNEFFPMHGHRSLYGSTKLCSEMMIEEFLHMYAIKGVINRCGMIAGPWQMGKADQGLVGFWISRYLYGGDLKYIGYNGSGKQVRDILHVDDLCRLIEDQIFDIDRYNGHTFNVGGGRQRSVSLKELNNYVEVMTQQQKDILPVDGERQDDLRIYITDTNHITSETGWQPQKSLSDIFENTYDWMKAHKELLGDVFK